MPPCSPTSKVPPGRALGRGPLAHWGTEVLSLGTALSARDRGCSKGRWGGASKTQNKHITTPKGKVQSLNFKQEELGVRLSGR